MAIWCLIETPLGVLRVEQIAKERAALEGAVGYDAHIDHARRVLAYAELVNAAGRER